jgi:hypothetical protein
MRDVLFSRAANSRTCSLAHEQKRGESAMMIFVEAIVIFSISGDGSREIEGLVRLHASSFPSGVLKSLFLVKFDHQSLLVLESKNSAVRPEYRPYGVRVRHARTTTGEMLMGSDPGILSTRCSIVNPT